MRVGERLGRKVVCTCLVLLVFTVCAHAEHVADYYLDQGTQLMNQEKYAEAIEWFLKALGAEKQAGNTRPEYLALEHFDLGHCYTNTKDYDQALRHYKLALHWSEGSKADEAAIYTFMGLTYEELCNYEKARAFYAKALEMQKELKSEMEIEWLTERLTFAREMEISYFMTLVNLSFDQCSLDLAALDKKTVDEKLELAKAIQAQGDEAYQRGDDAAAWQNYQNVMAIYLSEETTLQYVTFQFNELGHFLRRTGHPNEALEYYLAAVQFSQFWHFRALESSSLNNLALQYRLLGRFEMAEETILEAIPISRELGEEESLAIHYLNLGNIYADWGQYDQALASYAEALSMFEKLRLAMYVSQTRNRIGDVHYYRGQYDEAMKQYDLVFEIAAREKLPEELAVSYENRGSVYAEKGQYEEALQLLQEGLRMYQELRNFKGVASVRNKIGAIELEWGQYEAALEEFRGALEIAEEWQLSSQIPNYYNSIGSALHEMGRYDEALANYGKARELYEQGDYQVELSTILSNIASIQLVKGEIREAIQNTEKALEIDIKYQSASRIVTRYNNLGSLWVELKEYEKALAYLALGLEWAREHQLVAQETEILGNLCYTYQQIGNTPQAIQYAQDTLAIDRRLGRNAEVAEDLTNLGYLYYVSNAYPQALEVLVEATEVLQTVRAGLKDEESRRTFLEGHIQTVQMLTALYVKLGEQEKAFEVMELSKALVLTEKLGSAPIKPSLSAVQKGLEADEALLSFSNSDVGSIISLVFTNEAVETRLHSKASFEGEILPYYETDVEKIHQSRFAYADRWGRILQDRGEAGSFEDIVYCYRALLMSRDEAVDFAKGLYQLLIKPLEPQLKGKKELVISPDGILSFIPFEALMDEDGKYLGEKYKIRYIQSYTIGEMLKQRVYPAERKPLLALGSPVYAEPTDTKLSPVQVQYKKAGVWEWNAIPASLEEVRELAKLYPGAKVLTGEQVTEEAVKQMSASGELGQYKVIHFAVHGLTVPVHPEYSALVLAQFAEQRKEDGYLQMAEIVDLQVQADFINLTACNTGFGKVYAGEGVYGFAQSFLVAGANSVAVTLWEINDQASKVFMVEFYRLVTEMKGDYAGALAETKRRFMRGDFGEQYRNPFYWAPYVYYGN